MFVLGKRLGCLEEEVPANCKVFFQELDNFLTITQDLRFNFPFHKFVATKNWKALVHSQKYIYDIAMSHILEKVRVIFDKILLRVLYFFQGFFFYLRPIKLCMLHIPLHILAAHIHVSVSIVAIF